MYNIDHSVNNLTASRCNLVCGAYLNVSPRLLRLENGSSLLAMSEVCMLCISWCMKRLSLSNLALNLAVYCIHHSFENISQAPSKPLYVLHTGNKVFKINVLTLGHTVSFKITFFGLLIMLKGKGKVATMPKHHSVGKSPYMRWKAVVSLRFSATSHPGKEGLGKPRLTLPSELVHAKFCIFLISCALTVLI